MIEKIKQLVFDILFRQTIIINSNRSLSDKVILITGTGRGIGKATATLLNKQGAKLALMSINDQKQISINFNEGNSLFIKGDVARETDCKKAVSMTIAKFGKIDVLINNAGIVVSQSLENVSADSLDRLFATNLKGMFLMTKAAIPYMKKQKRGLIINMGSKISHNANILPNLTSYASSKYAVEGFSNALASELRPFHIKVTCLMPGTVNTVRSLHPRDYLSPFTIAEIISMVIAQEDAYFESIIVKSNRQNI